MTTKEALQLAVAHHQAGRLGDAEALYRHVLAGEPRHPDALHLLGVLAAHAGDNARAIELLSQAVAAKSDVAQYRLSLITALLSAARIDEAIEQCKAGILLPAVGATPHFHADLGTLLLRAGQSRAAIEAFERALLADSADADAANKLGHALGDVGDMRRALGAYEAATRIDPGNASAANDFGAALREVGLLDDAVEQLRRAAQLGPQISEVHNNLANALKDQGRPDEAIAEFREAIRCRPDNAVAHSNLLFALHLSPAMAPERIAAEHRAWGEIHADPLTRDTPPHQKNSSPPDRMRIGYVSPDFRNHPVGRLLLPLLANHDRNSFEIVCYSSTFAAPDAVTQRLRGCADHWRDVAAISDEHLAALIRDDRIDILVDLSGHSAGNRLLAFARKPARVQITWLGYPNTTGMKAMDWRLTDAHADPPGASETFHSEQLIRLPRTAWCFDPPADAPQPSRDRAGGVTFGSFNSLWKLNDELLRLWAKVLAQTPGSRLLIKAAGLLGEQTRQRLLDTFQSAGVDADRIELQPYVADRAEHLATYRRVDVALDAFPYHGTMTTCESLWMGVGVVTLAGEAHVSRVGASLLTSAGLADLIATTPEQYVSIAADLARDPDRRADLRVTLRQRMRDSPLMDAAGFARDVECAYQAACQAAAI